MIHYIYRVLGLKKMTHRLFFWGILFLFFSSTIFLVIYVSTDRTERIARADAQLQRTLDNQQEIIESWAENRTEQIEYLSELDEVVNENRSVMHETFQKYISFALQLEALFFIDEDGDIVVDSTSESIEPSHELNVKDQSYFIAGEKGKNLSEDMYIRLQDDTDVILFTSPVYGENDQFQGIVLGAVSLNKINDLLQNTNLGISGETFIVNKDAELLLEVSHEQPQNEEHTEMYTAVTEAITEGKSPPKTYDNERGEEVLGHYSSLFNGLFYVIHEINMNEVLKTHEKMVRTILLLGIGIIALAILLIYFVLRDLQHSIASFTDAIGTIQTGNYDVQMDEKLYEKSSLEFQEAIKIFDSMTKTIRTNKQDLIRLSEIDALTDAYNRRTFMKDIDEKWLNAHKNQEVLSIAFIDIDHFKRLNDTFGHLVGDKVLVQITKIINDCIQETTGTLYRYGGEEFIVIFPKTDETTAYQHAETIRQAVEDESFIREKESNVTVSIGVNSIIPTEVDKTNDFIGKADKALYDAKQHGRNQVASVHI